MKTEQARKAFIDFFTENGHKHVASSPVIPHGDQTILFTNAGMNQFKETFSGREKREYSRAVTAQKCIRAGGKHNDLENVGQTARHLTFFEMLGNFSFGDYFKKEAINWAWEALTCVYGLEPDRLYATVYHEDQESREIWRRRIGLPEDRVVRLGEKENFWSMGETGPCGPCSELLYDRGASKACGPDCGIGKCDCDRYFEVWNLVFMQYDRRADGSRNPLPRPCIDTGMGVERLCMVLQGVDSVYQTDMLQVLLSRISELSKQPYSPGKPGMAHRVIADHIRALCFAIADGALPSNEGRGYVIRRILRRAARYGRMLKLRRPFLHELVDTVCSLMGEAYPELVERRDHVSELILAEEERFGQTLDQGLSRFAQVEQELAQTGSKVIPGEEIFLLHDTYGFPPDLVTRMAQEHGLKTDMEGYERLMEEQKEKSRSKAGVQEEPSGGLDLSGVPPTEFLGYTQRSLQTKILAAAPLKDASEERLYTVVLEKTPFYAEAGGQVGDTGSIKGPDFSVKVKDTQLRGNHHLHIGIVEGPAEKLKSGTSVTAEVDPERRESIQRHHTATHLLHSALRAELGTHVQQQGSSVDRSRLRFDFAHFQPVTEKELRRIEERVNNSVLANRPVKPETVKREEAEQMGAIALFDEKYGEKVRVVTIPGISMELCGGTHVARTGDIGPFKIVSETSAAANVRRIEAKTGTEALRAWQETEELLRNCARSLKTSPQTLPKRIESLKEEIHKLKQKKASSGLKEAEGGEEEVGEIKAVWRLFSEADMNDLRKAWDKKKNRLERTVSVLFGNGDKGVSLLVCVSPDLRGKTPVHCGKLASTGGRSMGAGGGGREDMGQAGGRNPGKIHQALTDILRELKKQLSE